MLLTILFYNSNGLEDLQREHHELFTLYLKLHLEDLAVHPSYQGAPRYCTAFCNQLNPQPLSRLAADRHSISFWGKLAEPWPRLLEKQRTGPFLVSDRFAKTSSRHISFWFELVFLVVP